MYLIGILRITQVVLFGFTAGLWLTCIHPGWVVYLKRKVSSASPWPLNQTLWWWVVGLWDSWIPQLAFFGTTGLTQASHYTGGVSHSDFHAVPQCICWWNLGLWLQFSVPAGLPSYLYSLITWNQISPSRRILKFAFAILSTN